MTRDRLELLITTLVTLAVPLGYLGQQSRRHLVEVHLSEATCRVGGPRENQPECKAPPADYQGMQDDWCFPWATTRGVCQFSMGSTTPRASRADGPGRRGPAVQTGRVGGSRDNQPE